MENVFARSGAKAINLFRKHIFRTQIALSLFYFIIVATVLVVSSQVTRSLFLSRVTVRLGNRIETETIIKPPRPLADDVQEDLRDTMLMVNGIFLAIAGIFGYFLAGATLEPLQKSYEKEQRFLNDASHELRTPLAILRTTLENIAGKNTGTTKERAEEALEEVDRMNNLLQNILTLSRAEEYASPKTPILCNDLLKSVVERMQPLAEKRACTLTLQPTDSSMTLLGDQESLERALVNLIQNAINYNKTSGSVTVSCERKKNTALIHIQDTGIGMSPEELKHLTERFYRAEKSRNRAQGGSGLGLAIVDQIIKNHKGTLQFTSTQHKGTTATITLPIHKAS